MVSVRICRLCHGIANKCSLRLFERQESLKPGFVAPAIAKLKDVNKFLGDNSWFAGSSVCCRFAPVVQVIVL
jgi:hypothetical protein